MTTPRRLLVDGENACTYHLVSRCVRRAWLCGRDPLTGRDCSHRKGWLEERLRRLAGLFAVEVDAYAVMDNHFHIVLHHDPRACRAWSDEEVARRWTALYPPPADGGERGAREAEAEELLLDDPGRLASVRRTLGSLSGFMKHLKQPIAARANREDGCRGHFFEQRFYSGALLGEAAVLAAMAYVDLNPVRARLARRAEDCAGTSLAARVRENSAAALAEYLAPLASGLGASAPSESPADAKARALRVGLTLREYVAMLRAMADALREDAPPRGETARWVARAAAMATPRPAYGPAHRLREWFGARGMRVRGDPLPA